MYRTRVADPAVYGLVESAGSKGFAVAQFSLGVMIYPIGDTTSIRTRAI
jgi:hypothetical protein